VRLLPLLLEPVALQIERMPVPAGKMHADEPEEGLVGFEVDLPKVGSHG
jgi:hypothetical protein